MESLHDICMQLMKPAKDLANWNFPLAELLSSYRELLLQAENLKFSEVGLIVENSANVYGRRVERLFTEALALTTSLQKQEEEKKVNPKEHRKGTKKIDLEDFSHINTDFKDYSLKDESAKKLLKLLPKQFIRVEKRLPESLTETILDVNNDIIGKKYSFRCNLDKTIDGILTDELAPQDFLGALACANNGIIGPTNLDIPNTSIDQLNDSNEDINESGYVTLDTFFDEHTNDNDDFDNTEEFVEENKQENKDQECKNLETNEECKNHECQNPELNEENNNQDYQDIESDKENNNDPGIESMVVENNNEPEPLNDIENAVDLNVTNANNNPGNEVQMETKETESAEVIDQIVEQEEKRDKIQIENQVSDKSRRSKRIKERNEKKVNWKPIPFDQGIPDKLPKKRKEFKLTSKMITLLTKNPRKRKRKTFTAFMDEQEPPAKKLDTKGSPAEIFRNFEKDTNKEKSLIEELKKTFESCLGSFLHEEPSFNVGFQSSFGKRNLPLDSPAYSTNMDDLVLLEPNSPDIPEGYTPPTSPEDFGNFEQNMVSSSSRKRNYEEIVQKKMKDVQKCRKRTVLEETVSRWHETIKPKLAEEEKRSAFHIHDYGSQILSAFSGNNERKLLLSSVVRNRPAAEAARFFTATLQLANTHNVEIEQSSDVSNIEVLLLNETRSKVTDSLNLPSSSKHSMSSKKSKKRS